MLRDADLATVSYWRWHQTPTTTSIKGSRIVAVTLSRATDGLKAGIFQVIRLELADGSSLLVAVDRFAAVAVEGALRGGSDGGALTSGRRLSRVQTTDE